MAVKRPRIYADDLMKAFIGFFFELVFICAIPQNKVPGIVGLNHPERASLTHCLLFMRYVTENEFLNIPTISPHQRARVPPYLQALLWYPAWSVMYLAARGNVPIRGRGTPKLRAENEPRSGSNPGAVGQRYPPCHPRLRS